ncbi:MAG: hypothetical protein FJ390_01165 [Verrucomicrobia bacterium]|nr:hypothetical protein [Verrucomicrobiota bacterium]
MTACFTIKKYYWLFSIFGIFIISVYAYNAGLFHDDLFLVEYLPKLFHNNHLGGLKTIFFSLDLPGEYRLYGLSRTIHLLLALSIGTQAIYYGIFIGISQLITGWAIYRLLRGFLIDYFQALIIAFIWIFSPFSVTFCFHHYSYLILPFQLTVVAALVLQQLLSECARRTSYSLWLQRLVLISLGCCIAWTGEAHLPLSIFILGLTALLAPSKKSFGQRTTELAIILAPIIIGVILHRVTWIVLLPKASRQQARYHFSLPNIQTLPTNLKIFFVSLCLGIKDQIIPIIIFVGNKVNLGLMSCMIFLAIAIAYFFKNSSFLSVEELDHKQLVFLVPLLFLLACVVSFLIITILSIGAGQISMVFPRRYGYIPYTLLGMLLASFFAEPRVRQCVGLFPSIFFSLTVFGLWLELQLICLPAIRKEDQKMWNHISTASVGMVEPSILFINAYNSPYVPNFQIGYGTPVLRGLDFPQIFESSLSYYWPASQYARFILGFKYSSYRCAILNSHKLRVFGNGVYASEFIDINNDSLLIVTDESKPSSWNRDLRSARIYKGFKAYQDSLKAKENGFNKNNIN